MGAPPTTSRSAGLVLVGFPFSPFPATIQVWTGSREPQEGIEKMHDLLIALAFVGMVIAPAVVAATVDVETVDESE